MLVWWILDMRQSIQYFILAVAFLKQMINEIDTKQSILKTTMLGLENL